MSNLTPTEALRTLTKTEALILYLKCSGLKYEQIGEKIGYSVEMVTVHMSRVYAKLGISTLEHHSVRKKMLDREFCPALMKMVKGTEDFETWPPDEINPPPPDSKAIILVIQDEAREEGAKEAEEKFKAIQKPEPIEAPGVIRIEQPRRRRNMPWVIGILALLVGIICIGTLAFLAGRIFGDNTPAIPAIDTPIPTIAPTEVVVVAPTETVIPTDTPAPTDTPLPTSTSTLEPTQTKPAFYEQGVFVEFAEDAFAALEEDFGSPNYVQCWAPKPGFNLVIRVEEKRADTFLLRYPENNFTVTDDLGNSYEVVADGIHGCDSTPGIREANVRRADSILVSVKGELPMQARYLFLVVGTLSGSEPITFRKDIY